MGLPTPNIYAGGNEFHSLREWVSVQDMSVCAATVVELLKVWAEPEWQAACRRHDRSAKVATVGTSRDRHVHGSPVSSV